MTYSEDLIREQRYMIEALQKENSRLNNKITQLEKDHKSEIIKIERDYENQLIKQRLDFNKEKLLESYGK